MWSYFVAVAREDQRITQKVQAMVHSVATAEIIEQQRELNKQQ